HQAGALRAIVSPDGKAIASSGKDKLARIWNVESGLEPTHLGKGLSWPSNPHFAADGRVLLAHDTGRACTTAWDVTAAGELWSVAGGLGVAVSPDGLHLATGDAGGLIRVGNIRPGKQVLSFQAEKTGLWTLEYSPDGKLLVTNGDIRPETNPPGHFAA